MHNLPAQKLTIKNDQDSSGQVNAIVSENLFIINNEADSIPDELYEKIEKNINYSHCLCILAPKHKSYKYDKTSSESCFLYIESFQSEESL